MSSGSALAARARVFSGYRRLFRARRDLFRGDEMALRESRTAIKLEFLRNRAAPHIGDHFEGLITMIDEAEDMLRHGIVRGELNRLTGHYEVKIQPQHSFPGHEPPLVEPITQETVARFEKKKEKLPVEVEVSSTSGPKIKS